MNILIALRRLIGFDKTAPSYKSGDVLKREMRDVLSHMEFAATMQLRTPLEVLNHHGCTYHDDGCAPPFQVSMADGIWVPVVDERFSALREGATMASDIGPLPYNDKEYLGFLKSIRVIVEQTSELSARRNGLYLVLKSSPWPKFIAAHGGIDSIVDKFFPMFITTISGLPKASQDHFSSLGCLTPKDIGAKDDRYLLSVPGIGPAKLGALRLACNAATDPEAEYVASPKMNIV